MTTAKPFLKWAGGKGKSAEAIVKLLPSTKHRLYREPFLGGGAIFFRLAPDRAVLSDVLPELMTTYVGVRDHMGEVVARLRELRYDKAVFLEARETFNFVKTMDAAPIAQVAALMIYLNRTCFNGLYRTNMRGDFNVPFGTYENPTILDEPGLTLASKALASAIMLPRSTSFEALVDEADSGDVIYMDPPYVPVSETSNFTGYAGGFGPAEQEKLSVVYRELDRRGCLLAISQSDSPTVRELYEGYDVTELEVARAINSKTDRRGKVTELLIRNVRRYP